MRCRGWVQATLDLSNQVYRLHVGVFSGSLHGTINHLLLPDVC
jgi:hypothetical protein